MRLEPVLMEEVRGRRGVEGDRRVTDVYRIALPDHVEPAHPREPGHAVGGQGASRPPAMRQDAPAREEIVLALSHLDLLTAAADRIDLHHARPPGRRIGRGGGRGRLLHQGEEHRGDDHWFGSVKWPPVPFGLMAVTTLKAGSDVKPSPSMCRFGSSNTKGLSELTWLFAWL